MIGKIQSVVDAEVESAEDNLDHRFTDLYKQHFDFVWRSVRMLGTASEAAEDVVQDVFLVAHRRLGDFEARASTRTWLFAIARRVTSAHRRGKRRRLRLFARVSSADRETTATPFDITARSQSQRAILAALGELPEEQRIIFSLTELEEMSAPEIASALGVNVNTVYSRLRIARRSLAARLRAAEREVAT